MLADKDRIFTNVYGFQPWNIDAAIMRGDWDNTKDLMALGQDAIIDVMKASGLRGRGGAGFPTGIKWKTVLETEDARKYIVANADEGDSGTFADRMLMEGDPYCLIEGMAIAGHATGAGHGYVYIRSE